MDPNEFTASDKYKDKHIWDLKYISTSDDEDKDIGYGPVGNDEDEDEEEGEAEQEEGQTESQQKIGPNQVPIEQLFKKNVKGQGNKVPDIAKALKPPK